NLAVLRMEWNRIGDPGARALANSPHLAGLSELSLSNNAIGDEGARALAASPHLTNLRWLDVTKNNMSQSGRAALRERFRRRVALSFSVGSLFMAMSRSMRVFREVCDALAEGITPHDFTYRKSKREVWRRGALFEHFVNFGTSRSVNSLSGHVHLEVRATAWSTGVADYRRVDRLALA